MIDINPDFRDKNLINHYFKIKDYENLMYIATEAQIGDDFGNDMKVCKKIIQWLYAEKFKDAYYLLALYYIYEENNIKEGLKILNEAISFNCIDSLKYLGDIYFAGTIVEEDHQKAIGYYEKAALLNDVQSISMVSFAYLNDIAPCTSLKSLNILNKGKKLNMKDSILCLAKYHETSTSINFDFGLALKYKEMCLDEDNFVEVKKLAFDYLKRSSSTDKYYKRMIELFEIASKNDDLDSLNLLGYFYLRGDIVIQDLNKSLQYYEKAQSLGDPSVKREINIINKKLKELNA